MANVSEVGAAKVDVESYQCSIKKVTVSTKWKNPDNSDAVETVSTTVYDNNSKVGKDIYIITSQKGKKVTINTDRDEGKCKINSHKRYEMSWSEYKKDDNGNLNKTDTVQLSPFDRTKSRLNVEGLVIAAGKDALISSVLPFFLPFNLVRTPLKKVEEIKNESIQTIKCFEIGGAFEALKYWKLPLNLEQSSITTFKQYTCKETAFQYRIITYPDIKFKIEFTIDSKDVTKDQTKNLLKKKFDWCRPTLDISTTYNGKEDKLELKIDFNKNTDDNKHEYVYFKYLKDNSVVAELGSEVIQQLPKTVENVRSFFSAVKKICTHEFIQEFLALDTNVLKQGFTPFGPLEIDPPSVSLTIEGKYRTSKDLTKIGKRYSFSIRCDPLIGATYTIDLLYLILNAVTSGAATGVYLLVNNLSSILKDLLGDDIKKSPVSANIELKLEINGKINASVEFVVDSIDSNKVSLTPIEGVLNFDLKARVNADVDIFFFATAAVDLSVTATSGITVQLGLENHIKEGEGLVVPFTLLFNGLKIKYTVKASAGLKKTKIKNKSYVGVEKEGEKKLLDKTEIYSHDFVFFKEKARNSLQTNTANNNSNTGNNNTGGNSSMGGGGSFGGGGGGRSW